jgi:hypothetical protein
MFDNNAKAQVALETGNASSLTPKEVRQVIRDVLKAAAVAVEIDGRKRDAIGLTLDIVFDGPGFPPGGSLVVKGSSAKLDDRSVLIHHDGSVTIPLNVYDEENRLAHQLTLHAQREPSGYFVITQIAVTVEDGVRQSPPTKVWEARIKRAA